MLPSGAASSTVNLLHLKNPHTVENIKNNTYPDDNSVEI